MQNLEYNATPPVVPDGKNVAPQGDAGGNQKVVLASDIAGENRTDGVTHNSPRAIASSTGAATPVNSGALASSFVAKAAPGRLYKLKAGNGTAGVAGWVHVLNSATLPGNGAVPVWRGAIGATPGECPEDFGAVGGLYCSAGIVIALSTTEATLTLGAATLCVDALVG